MEYERIRSFIISYSRDDDGALGEIYRLAVKNEVPVIRPEMRDFLRTLLVMNKPKSVLEIGTAVGYSTLVIGRELDKIHGVGNWQIDTYELDQDRVEEARKNIEAVAAETGLQVSCIEIHQGDAGELLKQVKKKDVYQFDTADRKGDLCGGYDLVFIDAAKAQYMTYMDEAIRLSHKGTVIVTDNILADGDVLESHFLVEKRDRTIHDRMREYIYKIKNDDRLETSILSVGDGAAVSVVR